MLSSLNECFPNTIHDYIYCVMKWLYCICLAETLEWVTRKQTVVRHRYQRGRESSDNEIDTQLCRTCFELLSMEGD